MTKCVTLDFSQINSPETYLCLKLLINSYYKWKLCYFISDCLSFHFAQNKSLGIFNSKKFLLRHKNLFSIKKRLNLVFVKTKN